MYFEKNYDDDEYLEFCIFKEYFVCLYLFI